MLVSARIPLGSPGIYPLPDDAAPQLSPQRMDVCAFVGVAPRGPAYVPEVNEEWPSGHRVMADIGRPRRRSVAVPVQSFDEYRKLFGGFEGPGLLPYAVAGFFEQGGLRAYIVRIVHAREAKPDPGIPPHLDGLAQVQVSGFCTVPLVFYARNEGSWGNGLRVELGFDVRVLGFKPVINPKNKPEIWIASQDSAQAGALLRLTDKLGQQAFAYCRGVEEVRDAVLPVSQWRLRFDSVLPFSPERIEIVEARIAISDGAGNLESFERLGLTPAHPRFLASVLCDESSLVWPHYAWAGAELWPNGLAVEILHGVSDLVVSEILGLPVKDAYGDLLPDDFFDVAWSAAEETPGYGITALAGLADATQLLVPDLYVPAQWAGQETITETRIDQAGAEFATCVQAVTQKISAANTAPSVLVKLILDPRQRNSLDKIAERQNQIIDFCEKTKDFIALLDVPPGLSQAQAEYWRAKFDTAWAAAYYPWLTPFRRAFGSGDIRPMPPSAVAAGIVARKETERGIQFGPANELAREIVDLAEAVPYGRADVFHPLGLNCFVREADGIRIVSARTLSRERQWRQLSVRRLVLMLRRTLLRETQWAVFEPNHAKLWNDLRHAIENVLRRLFRVGVFAGASEEESFFVRVLTAPSLLDQGQLVVEIGVAPAEPLEFILLRLRRDGDGTLSLEE